jgi:hypothetical protein
MFDPDLINLPARDHLPTWWHDSDESDDEDMAQYEDEPKSGSEKKKKKNSDDMGAGDDVERIADGNGQGVGSEMGVVVGVG